MSPKPKVVCLCGSTRFMTEFYDANMRETLTGKIVLTVGMSSHGDCHPTEEQKKALDELHFHKILLADEVLVLNVGGYIGNSTRNEIAYAQAHGRPIRYLETLEPAPQAMCGATMSGKTQLGNLVVAGPCILPAGHVAHDGRPDGHTDGRNCWGGE